MAWSLLPMALAIAGAWIDEHWRLGFTTWQSACRAAGFAPRSLAIFTLELLPTAVVGGLAGGLIVQLRGMLAHGQRCGAQGALAAHAGCTIGMTAGVSLCVVTAAWPLAVLAEALLAMLASVWLFGRLRSPAMRASVLPRTRSLPSA
jgi:hypothetical protein